MSKKENISELFPFYDCTDIREVLNLAVETANSICQEYLNIEGIILGYMRYCEKTSFSYPQAPNYKCLHWYVSPCQYEKNLLTARIWSTRRLKFHKDVYRLSRYYKKLFGEHNVELSMSTFYYLIVYLQRCTTFEQKYYVPKADEIVQSNDPFEKEFFSKLQHTFGYLNSFESNASITGPTDFKHTDALQVEAPPVTSDSLYFSTPLSIDYTTDVTYNAAKNKYYRIIGRQYELNRVIDILSKMGKNNAVLIGNPGVGKTAIVQALAQMIVDGTVPNSLRKHRILEFNPTEAISGCKYRGEFEDKIRELFSELENCNEHVILYIDEIHTMVGLGAAEGALDMSTMIKPFLLNSDIKVIGSSTYKEYRKLESDKALDRRFETISVNEPSIDETLHILTYVKTRFEKNYSVRIPTSTLEAAISLSQRYIPERFLPDKAIDVLDESCSIKVNSIKRHHTKEPEILLEDILICISRKKMIPLNQVQTSRDLTNLEKYLNSKIIGQSHVVNLLAKAIRRTQAGLNDANRPFASFMFVGPTGVGKTEVAKSLADIMFSGRDNIIRFDMSEYQEEHTISKLIGAPLGYKGYEDAGLLTEQVRRHPYSLVLFDEIEKAHPKIYTLLLQVLDDGILTDSHGEQVNFKNTIIILTSNVGIRELSKGTAGFIEHTSSKSCDIMASVKKAFPPEFLNRLDEIVTFNWLEEEDIHKIAKLCISTDIISKLNSQGITVDISDEAIERIAKLGYSHEYGARELKRAINRELKNPLADFILNSHDLHHITVKLVNDELVITSEVTLSV